MSTRSLNLLSVHARARAYGRISLFCVLVIVLAFCGRDGARASTVSAFKANPSKNAPTIATGHADNFRDAWFDQETILTPSNVGAGHFGKLFTWAVASRVMAQLLICPGVSTSLGIKDLLIVTALSGQISAFDANNWSLTPVWQITMPAGFTKYGLLYNEPTACLSTPVADVANGWLFAVCGDSSQHWTIYKLNLATGATITNTAISGQFPGTGDPAGGETIIGGQLQFLPTNHAARGDLLLLNGNVYVGFSSPDDNHPWHGWGMAYAESNLAQIAVFCSTPSDYGGGFWGSGAGFAADPSGNIYTSTGNGGYDGLTAFANSFLKLSGTLTVLDWFTPSNWATLKANDLDLASSHAMPIYRVNNSSLIVGGGKDYRAYAIDSTCMGHLQGSESGCAAAQLWATTNMSPSADVGIYGGTFANSVLFTPTVTGPLDAFSFSASTGTFNTTAISTSGSYQYPGAQVSYSSNGTANGIVWALTPTSQSALGSAVLGTMRAFDPSNLTEIYNTDQTVGDALGQFNKFHVPVIWRGRVFVGADFHVLVYGLGAH